MSYGRGIRVACLIVNQNAKTQETPTDNQSEGVSFSFAPCCLVWISSSADCKYIFFQIILTDSCFSSLRRLSRYRESHCMIGDGIKRSGTLVIIANNKSSVLLWKFSKNSFSRLRSFSSMSIMINSLKSLLFQ